MIGPNPLQHESAVALYAIPASFTAVRKDQEISDAEHCTLKAHSSGYQNDWLKYIIIAEGWCVHSD